MDIGTIGNNLEALAEEDDEEEDIQERTRYVVGAEKPATNGSDYDSNTDDEEDDDDLEAESKEPNKFDGLCDGVHNSMALVYAALTELLELKDDLLRHALPPTLLVKLALTTGKVFRSMSDMSHPVNELIRMVRVYSTPWEAKSAALKKLHENYESKQRQLNIAIKRLQLVDAHSKRIAKEKRIMNWEKLFAKLTTARGHGRRWKFLIEAIKQKAKMGLEHVHEYTRALEEMSDSEEEGSKVMESSQKRVEIETPVEASEHDKDEEEGAAEDEEESDDEDEEGDEETDKKDIPTVMINIAEESDEMSQSDSRSRSSSPKRVKFEEPKVPPVIKPPTRDNGMSTGEAEYDVYLHVRVFTPEDINKKELKCSLTFGSQRFKTGILDAVDEEDEEPAEPVQRPQAAGRGRNAAGTTTAVQDVGKKKAKHEEFMLRLPDEIPPGVIDLNKSKEELPKSVQIAVHYGKFEEIYAMASIEIQDLKELDLRTVYLPPPKGDDDVPKPPKDSYDLDDDFDSLSHSTDLSFDEDESDNTRLKDDPVKDVDPLPFPLFSLHGGRSDTLHMPCGNLPLVLYWGKKRRPTSFNRQCGTYGVKELVFDLTGIDLNTTTKEDLHKDLRDEATSALEFTPEPQEETILKAEYDDLVSSHNEDMQILKETYENQLKELVAQLQQMELDRQELLLQQEQQALRPHSEGSRATTTSPSALDRTRRSPTTRSSPSRVFAESRVEDKAVPFTPAKALGNGMRPLPAKVQKPRKNFRIGRPLPKWGESLPEDFMERLQLYQEESKQHMAELNEKTLRDIRDSIEKKLAGQHKLSKHEEKMYDALKDVSLPALFMPFKTGTIFNPRAHQYFHPTGSTDLRLTQPPSMFQLPPLPKSKKLSVVNLFELSSNFSSRNTNWLMERYIHQQHPVADSFGRISVGPPGQSTQPVTNYVTRESSRAASVAEQPPSFSEQNVAEQEVEG
ncbi:uncharacterized protein LOC121372068 [Gigantopelta aegis]|uniref:uncharacterized protein LOC121372068 n=1 Tax=Gigantopelta aegis TaxID=1735272 RepID=UPI001B887C86|nr:uncharacterized protein LOC121372068 [Gigantopelta aegis]